MPRTNKIIRIGLDKLEDKISKAGNAGKLGVRTNKGMPNIVPQQDFPNTYNLRSKKAKLNKKGGSVMSKKTMSQVQFKEEQINLSGKESNRIDNFEFQNKKPLVYNPFAEAAGSISEVGGHNKGGSSDYKNIKPVGENILPKKFVLGKKTSTAQIVINPEHEPPVLKPGGSVNIRTTIRIR